MISLSQSKRKAGPAVVTIGVFDGVHLGHQKILSRMTKAAGRIKASTAVITFTPHPSDVLGKKVPGMILSLEHRLKLLGMYGVDLACIIKFDKRLAAMEPERFMRDIAMARFDIKELFVGRDFGMGKDRRGSLDVLKAFGKKNGFKVTVVERRSLGGRDISSTRIRGLVLKGDLHECERLLGRRFSVLGTVVHGYKIGRKIGVPTANLNIHHEVTPPSGVYAVFAVLGKTIFKGVANIGFRPTFSKGQAERSFEVHLFDFNKDIYGKQVEVFFVKRLRAEKRFVSDRSLVEQIHKDMKKASVCLKGVRLKGPVVT